MTAPMRIVLLGDGVAGWAAAAMLAGALPAAHALLLVPTGLPDHSLGPFGPAEASLPSIRMLHVQLGLDEDRLLRDRQAAYALGIAYSGWSSTAPTYFQPFGDVGAGLDTIAFHQLAGRLRAAGDTVRFGDYSLPAMAAQMGRFARPLDDPSSVLSTYTYGLHVRRDLYAAALRERALARGVKVAGSPFRAAVLDERGDLAALRLESGETLHGDLFIDASGPQGRLIGGALGTGFESWQRWLPCDRAVESLSATSVPPAPYSHVEAHDAGWRRVVPFQGGVGELLLSCSGFSDGEGVVFESGRRKQAWTRNCIALGAACATAEPLQSTALHLLHSALARLLRLFPASRDLRVEAAEYNRQTGEELDRLRDLLILRYKLNGRRGQAFWDAVRTMEVPAALADKMALFESRGRVPLLDGDLFDEAEWADLLDAHGVRPRRYDPRAEALPAERIQAHLAAVRSIMLQAAASLPMHGDYLAARRRESAR